MAWETDVEALSWLEQCLAAHSATTRRAVVDLLSQVECAPRGDWLARAAQDADPHVRAAAALAVAQIMGRQPFIDDLHESEFAQSCADPDLLWEWEYGFKVIREQHIPSGQTIVWTKCEDDALARQLALMKALAGVVNDQQPAVAILVRKRYVNQFTRAPRSMNEAKRWAINGRPRYRGP